MCDSQRIFKQLKKTYLKEQPHYLKKYPSSQVYSFCHQWRNSISSETWMFGNYLSISFCFFNGFLPYLSQYSNQTCIASSDR